MDSPLHYSISHVTKFRYSASISESIMEVRMQPRSEGFQRCLNFQLYTNPRAHILSYRGELGNKVHHFDVPNRHSQLTITAEAFVELTPLPTLPDVLDAETWQELDALTATDEYWDTLMPSHYAHSSALLHNFAQEFRICRLDDPLTTVHHVNTVIHQNLEYAKKNTTVDSPIDDALRLRRGVCQDFAHIMITLLRELGVPCRYVSGYLSHADAGRERSSDGATHAWVEALLPGLGWVGFDPTNDTTAGEDHIRIALGRDYADVPPTKGTFRGKADSELSVSVKVTLSDAPPLTDDTPLGTEWMMSNNEGYELDHSTALQQEAQQQ